MPFARKWENARKFRYIGGAVTSQAAALPPELVDRVFRDPVHGLIDFKGPYRPLQTLLETRAFQRLRRIKQMGFASLVYPGAEHSRFGHALGAYHIARRIAARLSLEEPIEQHVLAAALLHDVGHGPFSHAWEQAFPGIDHERWGQRLVTEDDELRGVLERLDPGLPEVLVSFWNKTYRPTFARKLVSSQLDSDRLDYLLRDGHYSGAGYATYDLEWILHALRIERVRGDHPDPADLVVDYRRGMYAVEQYLFARSYMYAQVYHHKTVRAAEWMFLRLLQRFAELARQGQEPPGLAAAARLARGEDVTTDEYLWLDDYSVTAAIDAWAGRGPDGADAVARDDILRDLSRRFVARRLFKTLELGNDAALAESIASDVRQVVEDRVGADAASYYYAIDTARQTGYTAEHSEELHVVGHPVRGLVTLGQLFKDMPLGRTTATVRVLCAPELVSALRPLVEEALR